MRCTPPLIALAPQPRAARTWGLGERCGRIRCPRSLRCRQRGRRWRGSSGPKVRCVLRSYRTLSGHTALWNLLATGCASGAAEASAPAFLRSDEAAQHALALDSVLAGPASAAAACDETQPNWWGEANGRLRVRAARALHACVPSLTTQRTPPRALLRAGANRARRMRAAGAAALRRERERGGPRCDCSVHRVGADTPSSDAQGGCTFRRAQLSEQSAGRRARACRSRSPRGRKQRKCGRCPGSQSDNARGCIVAGGRCSPGVVAFQISSRAAISGGPVARARSRSGTGRCDRSASACVARQRGEAIVGRCTRCLSRSAPCGRAGESRPTRRLAGGT